MQSSRRFRFCAVLAVLPLVVSSGYAQNKRSAVSITGSDLASCTVPDPCRNSSDGIISLTNGTLRAFGNTVTNNVVGLSAFGGTIESAGHNMIPGNGTDTIGTTVSIAPM